MTYASRIPSLAPFVSCIALALAACDGDLGKDDTGGDTQAQGSEGSGEGDASATAGGGDGPAQSTTGAGGTSQGDSGGDDGPATTTTGTGDCTDQECGPAPGAPAVLCPDGVNYEGPGPCERDETGVCAWTWVECPACCDVVDAPDCIEPVTCCGDGSWVCDDATACPGGETALECDGGAGGTTGGEQCVPEQGSCSDQADTCCAGLQCCAGVPVPPGQEYCGMECPISDVDAKENFATVDVSLVLDKVRALDIMTWNYKTSPDSVRHVGPMAQDFKAAFDVGSTDKAIFQVDADGVALASIQALDAEVTSLRAENAELRAALKRLTARVDAMR